jgi:membrane associated rhomboid family serine protease
MGLYDRDYMRPQNRTFLDVLRGLNALHVIIWANIIVFVAQYLFGIGGQKMAFEDGSETFMPYGGVSVKSLAAGHVWTALTYMFVHGSLLHIGGNLLMIYFVGKRVLALLGTRNFLNIYFLSGLVGAAAELFIRAYAKGDMQTPIIGASACGFGLFMALAVMFPQEEITALIYFIFPVKLRLWTMAMIMLGLSVAMGLFFLFFMNETEAATWANFAHLGGALTGWYYLRLIGYGGSPMTYERLWREKPTATFGRRQQMVKARHRRLSEDLELDLDTPRKPSNPTADIIREEVDPILEKISEQGMSSLTDDERRTLERASREINRIPGRNL